LASGPFDFGVLDGEGDTDLGAIGGIGEPGFIIVGFFMTLAP
jgi:hypothetical protein